MLSDFWSRLRQRKSINFQKRRNENDLVVNRNSKRWSVSSCKVKLTIRRRKKQRYRFLILIICLGQLGKISYLLITIYAINVCSLIFYGKRNIQLAVNVSIKSNDGDAETAIHRELLASIIVEFRVIKYKHDKYFLIPHAIGTKCYSRRTLI